MKYLGGKAKIARHVVDVIERYRAPAQPVWEPFCGGLNVTRELARRGIDVIATDASWPLIALVQAVRAGWQPPAALSESEWAAARALPVSNPLHGFAGGRRGPAEVERAMETIRQEVEGRGITWRWRP